MRLAVLLLLAALPLSAEFLRIDVAFEDIGCAACVDSLEGRLARVRGVERVEIDSKRGVATLQLALKNRVRLRTLLSRITQDGTKIARIEVIALGSIGTSATGFIFELSGLAERYALNFDAKATAGQPQPEQAYSAPTYKVQGIVSSMEVGTRVVLQVTSIVIAEAASE